jgi:SPP1 gp7 family putative phage head morphogenesis protein
MNIVQIKKHVDKLHKKIFKIIKKEFLAVANDIYSEVADEAIELGFDGDWGDLDEAWIEGFFEEYSSVTKYVLKNEIERKFSRLFEALVSDLEERLESYSTTEKLLTRQVKQSSIEFEDEIAEETYRAFGVKKVMWIAEKDDKTCSVCSELDGEIFDLDKAPDKQHINCRCYLIPVKE